ncbi:Fic family protein [Thauera sp.]|uniref:Fic family protein n=1 Tax=Thauera sp. TaxID=1905334 RepID=UPI0039E2A3AB
MEIISPGHLPDSLSVEDVRQGKTNRRNPTLTEHAFRVLPYRGLGSGIPRALEEWPRIDLVDDVRGNQFSAVVRRPEAEWASATARIAYQVAPPVTGEVGRLLKALRDEMKRTELQNALGLKHEDHFRDAYLRPALELGMVEMIIPDKPRSRLQKYRLTSAGRRWLQSQRKDQT